MDNTFQETASKIEEVIEKSIRPAMKHMNGGYWPKVMEDLKKIEALAAEIRREAQNLGI